MLEKCLLQPATHNFNQSREKCKTDNTLNELISILSTNTIRLFCKQNIVFSVNTPSAPRCFSNGTDYKPDFLFQIEKWLKYSIHAPKYHSDIAPMKKVKIFDSRCRVQSHMFKSPKFCIVGFLLY